MPSWNSQKKYNIFVIDYAPKSLPLADLDDLFRRDGIAVLAVLRDWTEQRPTIFLTGFRDYIGYPFIAAEIAARLGGVAPATALGGEPTAVDIAGPTTNIKSVPPISPTAREAALVEAACNVMLIDISIHQDLDSLARRLGSNRNSLARAFRRVLGQGAYTWLRKCRMDAAARLLKRTDISVQEISFDVGFEDTANFSTAFRQLYGLSPRAYRKAVRISKL